MFEALANCFTREGRKTAAFHWYAAGVFRTAGFRVTRRSRTSVAAEVVLSGVGVRDALALSIGSVVDFVLLPGLRYPLDAVPRYLTAYLLTRNQLIVSGSWRAVFSPDGCTMALGQVVHPDHVKRGYATSMLVAMAREAEFTARFVQKHVAAPR